MASHPPSPGLPGKPGYGGTGQPVQGGTGQPVHGGMGQPAYSGAGQPVYGACCAQFTLMRESMRDEWNLIKDVFNEKKIFAT